MATISKFFKKVLDRYPIRNEIWTSHVMISATEEQVEFLVFSCEMSMLTHSESLDPWNRKMPAMSNWKVERDSEGEVLAWEAFTTVNGMRIQLDILND